MELDYEDSDVGYADLLAPPEEPQVNALTTHLLVSSKSMSLASPVFKTMLGESFKEGEALRADSKVTIPLDDDAVTFVILANFIHHKTSSVPVKADLDLVWGGGSR